MVELADTPDLGSGAVRREGSTPSLGTFNTTLPYPMEKKDKNHDLAWSQLSSRIHFTPEDFKFVRLILEHAGLDKSLLDSLDKDITIQNDLLDHEAIIEAILDSPKQLQISPDFFFYVLIRKSLLHLNIYNRNLADYLASLLKRSIKEDRTINDSDSTKSRTFFYIFDSLQKIGEASSTNQFYMKVNLGNQTLYFTGLFEEYIRARTARKGAPDLSFYENIGSTQYLSAHDHQLAKSLGLKDILMTLGSSFPEIRKALNYFSDHYISLGDSFFSA